MYYDKTKKEGYTIGIWGFEIPSYP